MTKLLTVVTLISALLLMMLAGIFTSTTDRYFPLGTDATVLLSVQDSPASRAQVLQALSQWSQDSEVDLYLQATADEDQDARLFYGIGPASPQEAQEVGSFLPWEHSQVLPESTLGNRNLGSSYVPVGADAADRESLTHVVEGLGGEAWWTSFDWRLMLVQSLVDSGAAVALVTSWVLLVTSVLMWVLSRARKHDLQFLTGAQTSEIILEDAGVLVRRILAPVAVVMLLSWLLVLLVSGGQFANRFIVPLLVGQLLLLGLVVLTWTLTAALSWPSRRALAARQLPGEGFGLPSEALRLVALTTTALALPLLVSGLVGTQKATEQEQQWSRLDGWVSVRTGSWTEEMEVPARRAAIDLTSKDQLAFSKAMEFYSTPDGSEKGPADFAIIITDESFLGLMDAGPIDGPNWKPIDPKGLSPHTQENLLGYAPLWLQDPSGLQAPGVHLLQWQSQEPLAALAAVIGEMGYYQDPLVLVVDDAGQALTGNLILASMSTGNVLFGNADAVYQAFDRHGVRDVINSVDRAADAGMLRAQLLNQTLWLRWVSLGLVLAALALSTAVGAEVWARRLSRRIFVLHTAGYSWRWIARRRLLWEALSTIVLSGVGALFLLQLQLSPWWALLLPLVYLPLSVQLHSQALQRRFQTLLSRGP